MIPKNRLKAIRQLTEKKGRQEQHRFIVESVRAVGEAASSGWKIDAVLYMSGFGSDERKNLLLTSLLDRGASLYEVSEKELEEVSNVVTSQGIVAVAEQRDIPVDEILASKRSVPVVLATDELRDPGNLGTVIRAADWFGIRGVVLGKGSVDLYNPKVVRSTVGSLFHLPVAHGVELHAFITQARAKGYKVAAADQRGEVALDRFAPEGPLVLVIGNEAHGVSPALAKSADVRINIPKFGEAESLNATAAASIILWHLASRTRA